MTKLIDTNVLLRLLIGDVPEQRDRALGWLDPTPGGSVLVIDAVLVELLFQLESRSGYGLPRSTHLPRVRTLLQSECFLLDPASWTALDLMGTHPKLDFTDCLLIARSRSPADAVVLSFDRELIRVAGT